MNKIFLISLILFSVVFAACKKEREDVEIRYYLNEVHPGTHTPGGDVIQWKVNYYANGEHHVVMLQDSVSTWSTTVLAKPGDIAYMYVEFNEDIENNMKFSAGIQFERQLFREARNWHDSDGDTLYSIKLAGTLPFVY